MFLFGWNLVHSISSWIENNINTKIWKIIIFGYFMQVNKAHFLFFKKLCRKKPILFKIIKNVSPPSKMVIISWNLDTRSPLMVITTSGSIFWKKKKITFFQPFFKIFLLKCEFLFFPKKHCLKLLGPLRGTLCPNFSLLWLFLKEEIHF